jgi:very-short-patch-repair endonuclease
MKNEKITTEEFIKRSKLVHGDRYDYSITNYINKRSKVKIICKKHGIFEQTAYCHYYFKQGCSECKVNKQLTTEEFIKRSKLVHGDRYDYSLVNYKNAYTKVDIICKKHGIFSIRPSDHKKCGCSLCSLGYNKNNNISEEEYIKKAKIIHKNRYNYSKTKYSNSRSKVTIICKIHGDFIQKAESHLRGRGCPNCKKSNGENKIEYYLKNANLNYDKQKSFENCKNILNLLFDFYLPDYNICIEYDGIQHFIPIKYFGGIDNYNLRVKLDKIKNEYCKNNNIRLIRISYKENIEDKLNYELTNFLNSSALF